MSFKVDDAAPGEFTVQLWRGERAVVARGLAVPPSGLREAALAFETPAADEKLSNPFAGFRGGRSGRVGPPFGGRRPGG
jgi:hypothetical protein